MRTADIDLAKSKLPRLADGLAWALLGTDQTTTSPECVFQVVRKADWAAKDKTAAITRMREHDAMERTAVRKVTVGSSDELPKAPQGFKWELLGVFQMTPMKYEYGLVPKGSPSTAAPTEAPYRVRERVRVGTTDLAQARRSLPKLPDTLAWAAIGMDGSSSGPSTTFEVVFAEDFARKDKTQALKDIQRHSAVERSVVKRMKVSSEDELPKAPKGFKWTLLGVFNMTPMSMEYGLVPK